MILVLIVEPSCTYISRRHKLEREILGRVSVGDLFVGAHSETLYFCCGAHSLGGEPLVNEFWGKIIHHPRDTAQRVL